MRGFTAVPTLLAAFLFLPTPVRASPPGASIVSVDKSDIPPLAPAVAVGKTFAEFQIVAPTAFFGCSEHATVDVPMFPDRELPSDAHRIMATPEMYPMLEPDTYRYGVNLTLWKCPHDVSRGEVAKRYGVDHGSGERDLALLSRWLMS